MAKALVVDDSKVNREVVIALLKDMGYEVIAEAANGETAYETYKEIKPDFVTMDINMSDGNGITATQKIMQFDPDAKIIMISAIDDYHTKDSALLEANCKDYVTKPVQRERLQQAIDDLHL